MWTPDVYQGSPTAVTAFMSSGAKIAGFAALLPVFATAFPSIATDMTGVLWAISRSDHDPGQPGFHIADKYQTHARLFQHCPRWVHPHGVCALLAILTLL